MLTATKAVQRVEVYGDKRVMVVYEITIDDPNDDLLPAVSNQVIHLQKETTTPDVENEGETITTVTDISNHDPLVQTICNAVWADDEEDEAVE
jgi:hypothetical protein